MQGLARSTVRVRLASSRALQTTERGCLRSVFPHLSSPRSLSSRSGGGGRIRVASMSMSPEQQAVIDGVHADPHQCVVYLTGGAAQGAADLLSVPGASGTVLEVVVGYARESLVELLDGVPPKQYAGPEVARDMAAAAYRRACALTPAGAPVVGLAAACALASAQPKKGDHRCEVAAVTHDQVWQFSLTLAKGARTRAEEERVAALLLVRALADASGLEGGGARALLEAALRAPPEAPPPHDALVAPPPTVLTEAVEALYAGETALVEVSEGAMRRGATRARLVLPGSFNPVHDGHRELLAAAAAVRPGKAAAFELAVANADKGMVPLADLRTRVAPFQQAATPPLLLTTAPLYLDKARLLPGASFVIGMDTAVRLVMPKYYGGSEAGMVAALSEIRALGCEFLVGGRLMGGEFVDSLDTLAAPECLRGLFHLLPDFRSDLSSTALREQQQQQLLHPPLLP